MAEELASEKVEQPRDVFTFVATVLFVCLFVGAANGVFELGARRVGGMMGTFRVVSLYVAPGLLCGFAWRKLGIVLGALTGAAVRLLSVVGLGFIMPYVKDPSSYVRFSMAAATAEVPHLLPMVLASAGAGVVAALLGAAIATTSAGEWGWFRALRKMGLGLLTLGFVAAGGMAFGAFVPWRQQFSLQAKLQRLERWITSLRLPLSIVITAGVVLCALCVLVALPNLRARPRPKPQQAEEQQEQDEPSAPESEPE